MKVQIENRQTRFKVEKKKIRATVSKLLKLLDCDAAEVSICFTDDQNIRLLNQHYLGRNKATNVLSFSLQEGEFGHVNPLLLGDVVISVDTAHQDARKGHLTLEQEIDFLLIHGILHLLGYNHENTSSEEETRMQNKEKELFHKFYPRSKIKI